MSDSTESELLEVAAAYALHAVSDAERTAIERRVAAAPGPIAEAFDDEVRAIREAMTVVSAATAAEPPPRLRDAVLAGAKAQSPVHWRTAVLSAAAAVAIGLAAFGAGMALRPSAPRTVPEQVLAAPDVRTVSTSLVPGGTATVVFSRESGSAVLVMNNVPPPSPGSVYQMWLIGTRGPTSAGTMDAKELAPSATAVISGLGHSDALAFTVEPDGGSPQPTGQIFAELPLSQ
jgi:anti-sigma-K factor RskA